MRPSKKFKPTKRRVDPVSRKYQTGKRRPLPGSRQTIRIPEFNTAVVFDELHDVYNWGLLDLNIPEIHKQSEGEGVKIAVIDTGRPTHFDLEGRIVDSANFTRTKNEIDHKGHSTFVCGLIAADKNEKGVVGVAPLAQLYTAKALNDDGTGTPRALTNAVSWCRDQKVDFINLSLGFMLDYPPLHDEIKKAYQENITVVAAVGNSGTSFGNVFYPARYDEVIGVGAYSKDHKVANFSSRGINVMFSMPGADLYSTWLNNGFTYGSGTSYACPILTGICALLVASHRARAKSGDPPKTPCDTPAQILEHLQKYSIKLGNRNDTGFGTIDIKSMLNLDM
jgi:subtilisin